MYISDVCRNIGLYLERVLGCVFVGAGRPSSMELVEDVGPATRAPYRT